MLPEWMEAEMKKRQEEAKNREDDRAFPMMMMGGGPRVNYQGTKYAELFEKGRPFGEGGNFEGFPGRVTKHAQDRHHPDDDNDKIIVL